MSAAWSANDRNAVAFLNCNICRRLEQDFSVLSFDCDDEKGACGSRLKLANGGADTLAAGFRGDKFDFKTQAA